MRTSHLVTLCLVYFVGPWYVYFSVSTIQLSLCVESPHSGSDVGVYIVLMMQTQTRPIHFSPQNPPCMQYNCITYINFASAGTASAVECVRLLMRHGCCTSAVAVSNTLALLQSHKHHMRTPRFVVVVTQIAICAHALSFHIA